MSYLPLRGAVLGVAALAGCGDVVSGADASGPDAFVIPEFAATITLAPSMYTEVTSASFAFAANEPATFTCALDGETPVDCADMLTYDPVALGLHTFDVIATASADGATDHVAHTWQVTPPCVTGLLEAESISMTPPANWVVSNGGTLHGGKAWQSTVINATFQFDFDGEGLTAYFEKGPNLHTFSVVVDALPAVTVDAVAGAFSVQNPTVVATGLISGSHTAIVRCTAPNCQLDYFTLDCE